MLEHYKKTTQKNEFKETQLLENVRKLKTGMYPDAGPDGGDDDAAAGGPVEYAPKEARKKSLSGMASSIFRRRSVNLIADGNEGGVSAQTKAVTEVDTQTIAEKKEVIEDKLANGVSAAGEQEFHPVELEHAYTLESEYIYEEEDDLNKYLEEDTKEDSLAMKTVSKNAMAHIQNLKIESDRLIGKRQHLPMTKRDAIADSIAFFVDYEKELQKVNVEEPGTTIMTRYRKFLDNMNAKYGLKNEDHKFLEVYAKTYKNTQGNLSLDEIKGAKQKYIYDYSSDKEDKKFSSNYFEVRKEPLDAGDGHKATHNVQRMRPHKRPLFSHEPTARDVVQGDQGDCYLMASLNAIVEKDPKLIKDMMRDNGDTVTVRFYKPSGTPIYVTVKKTLSSEGFLRDGKDDEFMYYHTFGAAYGGAAFWVCMLEKAYAAVRHVIEPDTEMRAKASYTFQKTHNKYDCLDDGASAFTNAALLGKKFKTKYYKKLTYDHSSYISTSMRGDKIAKYSMENAKKEYKKELKTKKEKFDDVRWNIKRAELFFGVKIKDANDKLYQYFSDDKIYKEMQDHIWNVVTNNFTSTTIKTKNDGLYLLEYIKKYIDKMPELKIPGYDEKALKEHYLKYVRDYVLKSKKLTQTINKTGKYSRSENKIYAKIKKAIDKGKLVATDTPIFDFTVNKAVGKSGEKVLLGVAGNHQYNIRDVVEEEREIGGKKVKQKFVVIVNPWKDKIRQYDKDGNPYEMVNDKDKKIATGGAYKMELRDYLTTFSNLAI